MSDEAEDGTVQASEPAAEAEQKAGDPNAAAIAHAADAVAKAKAAAEAFKVKERQSTSKLSELEQKLAAMEEELKQRTEPVERYIQRERNARRIAKALEMGLDAFTPEGERKFTDDEILRLVPDADPADPAGGAAFAKFKQERSPLFRPKGVDYARVASDIGKELAAKPHPLFSGEKLAKSVFGGK